MAEAHNHAYGPMEKLEEGKGGKFVLSIVITGMALVAEVVGGIFTGSLALLSDAAHVFLPDRALIKTESVMRELIEVPAHRFGIEHASIQNEFANCGTCLKTRKLG